MGAISYIHKEHEKDFTEEQKPKILEENMVFGTVPEQAYLMRSIAVRNARSSRPVLHLSISFHQEEKISEEMREVIFDKILEELGATRDNNQFIIAQHFDAAHEHYHIVLNKVGFDRSNINTSYIINRCQVIADKIEHEVGLRRTLGRTVVYDPTNPKGFRYTTQEERNEKKIFLDKSVGIRDVKTFLKNNIDALMQQTFNIKELLEKLEEIGIDCNANFTNEGTLKGISFRYNNQAYKGTQLGLKSKAIENYYSFKNKDSVVENEKMNEVPVPADKAIRSEKQIFDETKKELLTAIEKLENFGDHYKNTTQEIAEKIRAGENRKDVLLQIFLDSNFKIQDDQLSYGRYSFDVKIVDDWIDRSILSFQKQVMEYEKNKLDYDTLMSQNKQDISFLMLPSTRNRIRSENKELKSKQDLAKTPELEISGIGNETSFQQRIISQIKRYREKLQDIESKERLRLLRERQSKILDEARVPISDAELKTYLNNRMKYGAAEDYKTNFLEYYEHESDFKDLLWLDKCFSILETDDDKITFLEVNFHLTEKDAIMLGKDFLEPNERIIALKKEIINWLPDRLIRGGENENKIDRGMRLR
ncbi:MAG: relaxase/mobilization nuclease domain-containing protein [Algoriella sp.]